MIMRQIEKQLGVQTILILHNLKFINIQSCSLKTKKTIYIIIKLKTTWIILKLALLKVCLKYKTELLRKAI